MAQATSRLLLETDGSRRLVFLPLARGGASWVLDRGNEIWYPLCILWTNVLLIKTIASWNYWEFFIRSLNLCSTSLGFQNSKGLSGKTKGQVSRLCDTWLPRAGHSVEMLHLNEPVSDLSNRPSCSSRGGSGVSYKFQSCSSGRSLSCTAGLSEIPRVSTASSAACEDAAVRRVQLVSKMGGIACWHHATSRVRGVVCIAAPRFASSEEHVRHSRMTEKDLQSGSLDNLLLVSLL